MGMYAAVGITPRKGEGGLSAQRTLKGSQVSIPDIRKMRQRSRRIGSQQAETALLEHWGALVLLQDEG